jgi:ferredoxin-NADP reductase
MSADTAKEFEVSVAARRDLAAGIMAFELASADGSTLPPWTPGSHLDVLLPGGIERQYSLCSATGTGSPWRIGVLREPGGRGGSIQLHDSATVGTTLRVRGPRNHFPFAPEAGARITFIAGGIGITPILPMVSEAAARGLDWTLDYAGRSRQSMAFVDELLATYPERVRIHAADEGQRLALGVLAADSRPAPGARLAVYGCGPARLLDAVEEAFAGRVGVSVHLERFTPKEAGAPLLNGPFEVELQQTGATVTVTEGRTILEAVEEAGAFVLSSCREGTCGTCETPIISGTADHRDSVLTAEEQAENRVMMVCVSRAACSRLVLDL